MHIPFLDLKSQFALLKEEIEAAFQQVTGSTAFAGGPFLARFEDDFAAFCNCRFAVGLGNGTEALRLYLLALRTGCGADRCLAVESFQTECVQLPRIIGPLSRIGRLLNGNRQGNRR